MAAVASLDVLVSRLRDLIREYGELRSDPAKNQPPAGSGDFGEERDEDEEAEARFQREITTLMKKMEATKKAVPEGMPEDEVLRYFWAVAELERSLNVLKERKSVLEKVVNHMQDKVQIIQNYSQEKRLIYEEFQRKVNEFERASPAKKQAAGSATTRDELEEVAQKIRATKLGYKEMKEFLGQLLPELCPEQVDGEGSKMGRLLQALWSNFFDAGCESYLQISHLDFDVDAADIDVLVQNAIAEVHPEDRDRLRLVDMTR